MTAIMDYSDIKPNVILRGPIFPEPVLVITTIPMGDAIKVIGKGLNTGKLHDPILSKEQLVSLEATPEEEPFSDLEIFSKSPANTFISNDSLSLSRAFRSSNSFTFDPSKKPILGAYI